MAKLTAGSASKLAYHSREGGTNINDSVAIRLADGQTGIVYVERSTHVDAEADPETSFFIKDADTYSATLVSGQRLFVVTDGPDIEIRIDGDDSGEFGVDE